MWSCLCSTSLQTCLFWHSQTCLIGDIKMNIEFFESFESLISPKNYSLIIDELLLHSKMPFWVNRQSLWNKQNLCHWLLCVCGLSALWYCTGLHKEKDTAPLIIYVTCRSQTVHMRFIRTIISLHFLKMKCPFVCSSVLSRWCLVAYFQTVSDTLVKQQKHTLESDLIGHMSSRTLQHKVHNLEISYHYVNGNIFGLFSQSVLKYRISSYKSLTLTQYILSSNYPQWWKSGSRINIDKTKDVYSVMGNRPL